MCSLEKPRCCRSWIILFIEFSKVGVGNGKKEEVEHVGERLSRFISVCIQFQIQ